jgi:Fibronectin type III domain
VHRGPSAVPIVVGGLVTTKLYSCTVTATNARGNSPPSAASTDVAVGAPNAPTGASAVSIQSGVTKVNFSPGANNGAKTTAYAARCTSVNGGLTNRAAARRSPVSVANLTPGKAYTCTVTGTNSRGTSPPSNPTGPVVV